MKKMFVALCAVAMLALGACQKETVEPQNTTDHPTPATPTNPHDDPEDPEPQLVQGEGIFNPGAHIVSVMKDGEMTEAWTWSDGKLRTVTPYENSTLNMLGATTFTYNGDRISAVSAASGAVEFAYNGDQLASASVTAAGEVVLTASVTQRSNDKITKVETGMSGSIINQYLDIFSGLQPGGDERKGNSKLAVDTMTATVTLTWQGDNVATALMQANLTLTTTLNELSQIPMIQSMIDSLAADNQMIQLVLASMGDLQIPIDMVLKDTVEYTYDQNHNPYYWYLGVDLSDFSRFSKANVLSKLSRMGLTASLPTQYAAMLQGFPSSFDIPMPVQEATYSYEYNGNGFPTRVYSDDGTVEYIYEQ